MDQLAGPLALVADHLARRVEGGEPAEAEAAQRDADGADGQAGWRAMAGPERR